jgi:hypothetical protein
VAVAVAQQALLQVILVEVHTILLLVVVEVVASMQQILELLKQVELEVLLEALQLRQVVVVLVVRLQVRLELLEQQVRLLLVVQAVVAVEQIMQELVVQEAQEAFLVAAVEVAAVAHLQVERVETVVAVVW